MELWRKYGSTDFETSSPILKVCINNQEERLTSAIINFHDVNSNEKTKQKKNNWIGLSFYSTRVFA